MHYVWMYFKVLIHVHVITKVITSHFQIYVPLLKIVITQRLFNLISVTENLQIQWEWVIDAALWSPECRTMRAQSVSWRKSSQMAPRSWNWIDDTTVQLDSTLQGGALSSNMVRVLCLLLNPLAFLMTGIKIMLFKTKYRGY